ncbi:MAG TPA: AlkA N-terminal domain-containing protein [Gemmatimonadaceae bacterium]|jgi:AraC family transcriptional regulator of adaptative response / DNA-3-methyladenine glycosylase II|nr:AlkA N-terminal domain-containing protein [Gemmatimonadaceae bacterium]
MRQLDDARRYEALIAHDDAVAVVALEYQPPYDWPAMLAHLSARATPGVEAVTEDGTYVRTLRIGEHRGAVAVRPSNEHGAHALRVELSASLAPALVPLVARVRRLFDLDADPRVIAEHFRGDATLSRLVATRPGLRVAGAADPFDLALRAVLGQQVTVRGATTLAGRVAALTAERLAAATPHGLTHLPASAERLARLTAESLQAIGLTRARAECIVVLARAVTDGTLPELAGAGECADPLSFIRRFVALPGIGPWTAEYVAMRALRWADAFPAGDLGLRKAMGGISEARLRQVSESWRPLRAYAAQHLWASL